MNEDNFFKIYKIIESNENSMVISNTAISYSKVLKEFKEASFSENFFFKEISDFFEKLDGEYVPLYGTLPLYVYNKEYYLVFEISFDILEGIHPIDRFTYIGEKEYRKIILKE